MSKNVSEVIVEVLEEAGVKNIYGVVGDTLNFVIEAISKSDINWVHVRHEEAGAFAAGAESYVSGTLAGCAGSCGPGSLHLINGVYEAHRSRIPLIVIASQMDTLTLGTDMPQEVDFKKVYSDCSVFCEQIQNPEQARLLTVMACQAAIAKQGPAVLIVPVDISKSKIKNDIPYSVHLPKPVRMPNPDELAQAAKILNEGKKVGIYAGMGSEGAHDLLIELAKKLNAPIAHTSRAKDFVEYDNPYNVGMTGLLGVPSGLHMMTHCDTLLLLGADFAWGQFYPQNAKIVQIDRDGARVGRRSPVALGLEGDVIPSIQNLLPLLTQSNDDSFLKECLEHRVNTVKELEKKEIPGEKDAIHPEYLTKLIDKYADDDCLLTGDCGSAMVWVLRHFHTNGKRRTLLSLRHGSMANAMPMALGLKKAYPNRQVISLSGDGGLSMLMGDLLTIHQENLPIKIIVLHNNSLNFVELEMKTEGLLNNYTDLKNPSFAAVGNALGIKGYEVSDSSLLEATIKDFMEHEGPAILDVHTNSYELIMPPEVTVEQVAGMATYTTKAIINGRFKDTVDLLKNAAKTLLN